MATLPSLKKGANLPSLKNSKLLPSLGGTSGGTNRKPAKLETVPGLEQAASEAGLGTQTARIKQSLSGEEPRKIFSGGTISDIFDVLSAGQYAAAGFAKGGVKGILPGIKQRASFADEDLLGSYGTAGKIAGIAADIVVDPTNLLLGAGILPKVGKVGKLIEAGQAAEKLTRTTKGSLGELAFGAAKTALEGAAKPETVLGVRNPANKLAELFVYGHGQDPIYRRIAETTKRNIDLGVEKGIELARPLAQLSPEDQRKIAEFRKLGKIDRLPPELKEKAKPAFDLLDDLGREAVKVGLLDAKTYEENVGKYIARLYRSKELPKEGVAALRTAFDRKPIRINLDRFKKRQDIPQEVREAMGEVLEAGYPTAKAITQLTQAVGRAKFFDEVAQSGLVAKTAEEAAALGFKNVDELKLPTGRSLGALAGKYVPEPIFRDLQEIVREPGAVEKIMSPVTKLFKTTKVLLNPSSHVRNIMSNMILNGFEGLDPLNPTTYKVYGQAFQELRRKGKLYNEARETGLLTNSFAAQELKDMLVADSRAKNLPGLLKGRAQQLIDKVAGAYQKEEEFAKMAQYIHQRSLGLSPEEAAKVSARATFDYAQVTPFIRRVRSTLFGSPFITFTYKATPQVLRKTITQPGQVSRYGKLARGVEGLGNQQELERERASEPQWMKDGFYMRLPTKDKFGRSMYLDLTFIMPFGDLVSGGLIQRQVNRETGLPENVYESLLRNSPALDLILSLSKNQDFFGNPIMKESDAPEKQVAAVIQYVARQLAPSAVEGALTPTPPGQEPLSALERLAPFRTGAASQFEQQAAAGTIEQPSQRQSRTLPEELARALTGLKVQPISATTQESQRERELRKALETLLKEQGVTQEFTRSYIPKKK